MWWWTVYQHSMPAEMAEMLQVLWLYQVYDNNLRESLWIKAFHEAILVSLFQMHCTPVNKEHVSSDPQIKYVALEKTKQGQFCISAAIYAELNSDMLNVAACSLTEGPRAWDAGWFVALQASDRAAKNCKSWNTLSQHAEGMEARWVGKHTCTGCTMLTVNPVWSGVSMLRCEARLRPVLQPVTATCECNSITTNSTLKRPQSSWY